MKTPKHTPGPWKFTTANNADYADVEGENGRICSVLLEDESGIIKGESIANVQLITTAPDLLETCETILGNLEVNKHFGHLINQVEMDSYISMLTKVIAKAKLPQ